MSCHFPHFPCISTTSLSHVISSHVNSTTTPHHHSTAIVTTSSPSDQPIRSCTAQPVVACLTAIPRRLVHVRHCTPYARFFLLQPASPFAVLCPFLHDSSNTKLLNALSDSSSIPFLTPDQVAYLASASLLISLPTLSKHVKVKCCQLRKFPPLLHLGAIAALPTVT